MKLDLSHLKVLGYHVCIHMSKKDWNKLGVHTFKGTFVKYDDHLI
jgi:hypothetical protein